MPGHNYADIAEKLKGAGLASQTPCAILSRATTPERKTFLTSIDKLQLSPRLPAPTLLIVGEVVRLADRQPFDSASFNKEIPFREELISAFHVDSISEDPVA